MKQIWLVMAVACAAMSACSGGSGEARRSEQVARGESTAHDQRMGWWRGARFGMFIHWGLYAVPAGEWEGKTSYAEWIMTEAHIPVQEYEKLRARFNPVKFDAKAWVRMAKDAGMKYIVITTKHHDGFCLFDSAYTDYDVMSTPFGRDVMKELSEAAREEGIRIGWYHSIMDWHHPDYLPRRDWEMRSAEGADLTRYVAHLMNQVREVLTKYGEVGVLWCDGEWEETWTHEMGLDLYRFCREVSPKTIINNRVDKGREGMEGLTREGGFAGDFATPEQQVPAAGLPGTDWESCITMNDHWGYNAADKKFKSTRDLVRMLVDTASKGGNLLLNIGPMANGEFPPESVERLGGIGDWMKANGESIYGTQAGPIARPSWGRCTMRRLGDGSTRLYLHVFEWPEDGVLRVEGLRNQSVRSFPLSARWRALSVACDGDDLTITLPQQAPDEHDSVFVLEVKGPVEPPAPAKPARVTSVP